MGFARRARLLAMALTLQSSSLPWSQLVRTPLHWAYGWLCFLAFLATEGAVVFFLFRWSGAI
jgi:hypothetical protein